MRFLEDILIWFEVMWLKSEYFPNGEKDFEWGLHDLTLEWLGAKSTDFIFGKCIPEKFPECLLLGGN